MLCVPLGIQRYAQHTLQCFLKICVNPLHPRHPCSIISKNTCSCALTSLLSEFGFSLFYQPDLALSFNGIGIDYTLLNIIDGWNIEHGFS